MANRSSVALLIVKGNDRWDPALTKICQGFKIGPITERHYLEAV